MNENCDNTHNDKCSLKKFLLARGPKLFSTHCNSFNAIDIYWICGMFNGNITQYFIIGFHWAMSICNEHLLWKLMWDQFQ